MTGNLAAGMAHRKKAVGFISEKEHTELAGNGDVLPPGNYPEKRNEPQMNAYGR
jgi:hypothetical protein